MPTAIPRHAAVTPPIRWAQARARASAFPAASLGSLYSPAWEWLLARARAPHRYWRGRSDRRVDHGPRLRRESRPEGRRWAPGGYSWVFPMGRNRLKVGAGHLGARTLDIPAGKKPAYHAAAVISSNFPVVLASVAGHLLHDIGIPDSSAYRAVESLMSGALAVPATD